MLPAPPLLALASPTVAGPEIFWVGAAAAFALLHLALWAFYREEPANLWLATCATGFAVVRWADAVEGGAGDWLGPLASTAGIVMALAALRFAYAIFGFPAPRRFGVALAAGAGLVLWLWLLDPPPKGPPAAVMVYALALAAELVRTVVAALRDRRPDSRLVGLGFLAFGLAGALQSLMALGLVPSLPVFPWGGLVLLLALSLALARRFAATTRDLERQLGRVRQLSAEALEQERRMRREEVRRRLLEAEDARKSEELERARTLQLALLPAAPPAVDGFEVAFSMETATEVGGDYYDFRWVGAGDARELALAVGDATGHGLDAGILVAATKGLFRVAGDGGPGDALASIGRGVRELGLRRMTMALLLARVAAGEPGRNGGRLAVAAAGMPPPLVLRSGDGPGTAEVEELVLHAPPLGALPRSAYPERELVLAPGELVVFYSDGLPERLDPDDEPFGYARLAAALAGAEGDAEAVASRLLAAARRWSRGRAPADDVTLVVVRAAPIQESARQEVALRQ